MDKRKIEMIAGFCTFDAQGREESVVTDSVHGHYRLHSVAMDKPQLPSTLNGIFDASLKDRCDPVRLTSDNIVPILGPPLAKSVE
jgi:hypothetical protein